MATDGGWTALSRRDRIAGGASGLLVAAAGAVMLTTDPTFYVGAILVWAGPVLALQWAFGWPHLCRHRRLTALAVSVPTAYLAAADRVAIELGVWTISPRFTTGVDVLGLPIAEGAFFLLTNVFVVQGLLLYLWVVDRHTRRDEQGRRRRGGESETAPTAASERIRAFAARRPFVAVAAVYVVLGGAYLVGWFAAPTAAFVAFLLLTWLHWGLGDLYAVVAVTGGDHLRSRGQRALTAAVRGALPMLVPLVAHPEEYRAVATLGAAFDPAAAGTLGAAFDPAVRTGVAVGLGLGVAASLALGAARADRLDQWALDAGETLLLVAFFAVVPPVAAIGLYFPLWHSLRHLVRVELLDPPAAEGFRTGRLWPAVGRFARDAAPLTAGALVVLGGLSVAAPRASTTPEGLLALYLVLLAVLALPHAAVAAWADYRQGVWTG